LRVVLISDTHGLHKWLDVPDGDLLIHAGDFSRGQGSLDQVRDFNAWLGTLTHTHKVVIAGNHDWPMQWKHTVNRAEEMLCNCTYLKDSSVTVRGFKVYGSPWQPTFCNWAFNLPRCGLELLSKWAAIPDDTDILVTHGPPMRINDHTEDNVGAGCELLANRVERLSNLSLHVFGHIHEAYGQTRIGENGPLFVNASVVNLQYQLVNAPVVIDL
jgi:Icc-related predicted phosphoesterase